MYAIRSYYDDVGVFRADPELVELIGRRALGVEPHGPCLGLAELRPAGGGQQRDRDPVGHATLQPPDEVDPRGDIAPLVAPPHLQGAPLVLEP